MDFITLVKYLYKTHYVPFYIYKENKIQCTFPEEAAGFQPPENYLDALEYSNLNINYIITDFFSYFGVIRLLNSDYSIVVGPISDLPYSDREFEVMFQEYELTSEDKELFIEFIQKIPQLNLDTFINILLFVNYTLNKEELDRSNITLPGNFLYETSIDRDHTSNTITEREAGEIEKKFIIEQELGHYIETGNTEKLKEFIDQSMKARVGTLANDNLRQWKNTCIVSVTLSTRAAIHGGLSESVAYSLSDIYIQQIERLTNVEAVKSLILQSQIDFTNRVSQYRIPPQADSTTRKIIDYITSHINEPITVSEIAVLVGFDRSYLTKKFKKEIGMTLSQFIRKTKLEEAKNLLIFSDITISEISNYLYFSSQSHFQRAFKEYTGITPDIYRKSNIAISDMQPKLNN